MQLSWGQAMPDKSKDDIRYETVPYTRGTVLHVGCGPRKAFPHFAGIDTPREGVRPDIRVEDCGDLSLVIEDASADAVYCDAPLVRGPLTTDVLKDWFRCLKVGGHLVLSINEVEVTTTAVIDAMRELRNGWDLVVRETGYGEHTLLVFKKWEGAAQTHSHLLSTTKAKRKTACVVRYGGFGDMLQAANVLPALKAQGYRVTMMTTPKGQDIIREDPNVDDWYIQDNDQVPNTELAEFWAVVSRHYDKFVNLCESVEGTLIAMPGRANHAWPHDVRHRHMNQNYLEFTAELAGVPYTSESKFYPTGSEVERARARLGEGKNIVFALAGSSCHKFYPGQDAVIANLLLEFPDCRIFLVGDEACKILELQWEDEPRVVRLSGEMSIRDTLALAKCADIVLGSETGVLNAVAFEANRKVVLLSHSSHENLTKHWVNTFSIAPQGLDCYPCHRLHYTREFCREDTETGAAMCQRMIDPADVFSAAIYVREEVA